MPKYVVISNHPPNSCPSGNKTLKEMGKNMDKELAPLLQKHRVKPETILHLDPGHKIIWVFEAPTAESVRDLVYESGLSRWNDFEFYMASSLEEVTAWTEKLPNIW
jgi:hypothetical protein